MPKAASTTDINMEQKKPWYKLRGVEYSTNFIFFLKNQVFSARSSNDRRTRFCSRLEKFEFEAAPHWDWQGKNIVVPEYRICLQIHEKLLNGGYGQGELVD